MKIKEIKSIEKTNNNNYPEYLYLWLPTEPAPFHGGCSIPNPGLWYSSIESAKVDAPVYGKYDLYKIPNPYPINIWLNIQDNNDETK
jgi:hypothetical protein